MACRLSTVVHSVSLVQLLRKYHQKYIIIASARFTCHFHSSHWCSDWLHPINCVIRTWIFVQGSVTQLVQRRGCTVEVWEWISNFIPHFIMGVITYPSWNVLCDRQIWWMTLENNWANLCYVKLCASFQFHRWSQTWVTVRKCSICDVLSRVTLTFDGRPWKTIGHLFFTTLSFVQHFKAMGEIKLKLQSGNAQFGSKSAFLVPCNLEIWQMTLKNKRAPFTCCFRLCASFHSHGWIQIGFAVRKSPIWVKIDRFF